MNKPPSWEKMHAKLIILFAEDVKWLVNENSFKIINCNIWKNESSSDQRTWKSQCD
jgi:hypothetical protein